MSAPTFSSFPSRAAPPQPPSAQQREKKRRSEAKEDSSHAGTRRSSSTKSSRRDHHDVLPTPRVHERSEPESSFRDVVSDGSRFNAAHTINAPTYRRRTHNVLGLPTSFKVEHRRDSQGVQIGSRDERSTRLPLEPPPDKIRRLAPEPAGFDQHAAFVGFLPRRDSVDDDFEAEFYDLPRSDAHQSQVAAMEQHLRAHPTDTAAWLKYSTLHLPPSLGDPLDGPFDQSSAEVSLAIIERALAVDECADLHLAYIRVARHILTPTQIAARWIPVLSTYLLPDDAAISVWLAYLGWCETDGFGTFYDIEEIIAIYSRVIRDLRTAPESTQVYLLLRVAKFLQNTGHDERSFALFQAMIEITFFKPPHLIAKNATAIWWDTLLGEFELFWDSETPRFGETGSTGWKEGIRPPLPSKPIEAASDNWYTQEISKLPDPYSVVLFDDIRSLLLPIISPEARLQLIHALLALLGIAIVPPDGEPLLDPLLYTDCTINWPKPERVHSWIQTPDVDRLHDLSMRCWAFDIDTLFANPSEWFSYSKARPPDLVLARQCMTQLQPFIPDPRFTMILLALDSTPKRAKQMLSQDRTNLNMWYAYASLEIGRHRYDAARSVFANALSFAKTQRLDAGEDELDLLAGWVQLESDLGDKPRAVDLLMLAVGYDSADFMIRIAPDFTPQSPTPTQLLRAGQYFANSHSRLTYFYTTLVRGHPQLDLSDESYLQFLCRQLWLDRSKASTKQLISTVDSAIQAYPNNTLFSTLRLISTEKQSARAAERMVESALSTSIIHVIWGIGEMARLAGSSLWKPDGSGAGRLRDLFQRAIRTNHGRQSSALWRIYIEFESLMGSPSAKQLCYRAVATVGSCKDLYLLPFTPSLRDQFFPQELRDWLLLMVERGIRIRVPFEHLLEVDDSPDLPSDDELEDDELAFLREAQRLKPYE